MRVDQNGDPVKAARITVRWWRRGRKEARSGSLGLVSVLAVVVLGEMPDYNSVLSIKFCGLNHLIRKGLVGVIPEINLVHVLKSYRQTVQFLFIIVFRYPNGLNKKIPLWTKLLRTSIPFF